MSDGGPAFPNTFPNELDGYTYVHGMSLRDYLAGQALAGLLAGNLDAQDDFAEMWARMAYAFADAMLKAREET